MDLIAVSDQLAARLDLIEPLRVFTEPPDKLTPPGAWVGYPDDYTYDATYGRGMDRMTVPVVVVVDKLSSRMARKKLAGFINPTGASSVKGVLEAGAYTAFHAIRVMDAEVDVLPLGGIDYLAALFSLDIAGQGS